MNYEEIRKKAYAAYNECSRLQEYLNASASLIDPESQLAELEQLSCDLPLYGEPVAVKDNVCTKIADTTASSGILQGFRPVYDAHITTLLHDAGAVMVAKTSMDELAMGGTNLSAFTGAVNNPYDLNRVSGGSSGGSAALAAAGAVRFAIGSDTGDSVRKPASYCGVIGVKPTYGRISRYGVIPYASSLDTVGYFTLNVKDAAKMLKVLAGRDDRDMTSSYEPVPDYSVNLNTDLTGKKIAVFGNVYDALEPGEVKESLDRVIDGLRKKGAAIEFVRMDPVLAESCMAVYFIISNCEASSNHSNLDETRFSLQKEADSFTQIMMKSRTEGFSHFVRKKLLIGSYGLYEDNREEIFVKAQKVRRLIVEEYHRMCEGYDALIAPACPHGAPLKSEAENAPLSDRIEDNHMILTNFSGDPSMSVPMGFENGMPVGLLISAKAFDEAGMFRVAAEVEEITGFKDTVREVGK